MAGPVTLESQAPANVLVNSVVKNLARLATRAWQKQWIITFTARTGVGKSTAVDWCERNLSFDRLVLRCKSITTRYSLLQTMGLEPGQKWNTHGRNWMRASDLYARIVEKIRERPYLLIVDEADRLRTDCFEMLRDFWDDARLPILLVGNEILTDKLNRQHERLSRRISVRFDQPPLREIDMRTLLEFMRHEVTDEEFSLLWRLVGGSPGFAQIIIENANEIADSHKVKRGIEALQGAVQYFDTLRKAV